MAQISNTNLQHVLDKMARYASEADGVALASAIATGAAYTATSPNGGLQVANTDVISALQTVIQGLSDIVQQGDFAPPANNLGSPILSTYVYSIWSQMRHALDMHALRYNAGASGDLSGLDSLLRVLNASAITLRAHGAFQTYFGGLSPANLFTPTPFTLATIAVTGATTANLTHVAANTAYGLGQIAILNTKAEGLTSTTLSLKGTQSGTPSTSFTATVATTTNNEITACSDTTQTWSDCTSLTSISGGNSGDTFSVVILPDRTIQSA